MTSTFKAAKGDIERRGWREAGLRYFSYRHFLRRRYGHRVQKVSLDAGFTCPNVDGTVALGGCSYCNNRSFSPSRRGPRRGIRQQIEDGIERMRNRYDCQHFTAYFQPATNTFGTVDRLREVFEEAIEHPKVVGLAVGTRADCVPDDVLDLLEHLASRTHLSVEYGLQSIHERSLNWMNRGHGHDAFVDAIERSQGRGFRIGAHVILGLPSESHAEMLATAREAARRGLDSIKIHNLHAVRGTRLADDVQSGKVTLLDRDAYVHVLIECLEILPPTMVVERVMGDAPPDFLIGPDWCLNKPAFFQALNEEMTRRDTWQGKRWSRAE